VTLEGAGGFGIYIHSDASVGVIVEVGCEKEETASANAFTVLCKDLAMQTAAMKPMALDASGISDDVIARERDIAETQARESGKPDAVVPKIAEGKIKSFFKEVCLLEQTFVKDNKKSIASLVAEVGKSLGDTITVRGFTLYQLGA
jgi:elongation factor Ts